MADALIRLVTTLLLDIANGYARRTLPGVGHIPLREHPEAVIAAVLNDLSS